ncbi:hypothetical protein G6M26_27075 [Agrobacterium tumefaciens]|nr:hypothetical protein [Agrobacterium tumefaciens]NTE22218.1 hypothetical protein [Agrobacterium tumefaciens]
MIISTLNHPDRETFNNLLSESIGVLNAEAAQNPKGMKKLAGVPLELYATQIMLDKAIGTVFENKIECNSGISFPDIIANEYYGVEVKTTIKNHWITTGNSVLETTRKKEVERIFLLFGKLGDPVEFRYRAYEDCLSEVVVTHSPRYKIDMNLGKGLTIFDKIKMPYDELRKLSNPIRPLTDYYKGLLKPGEELWWMDKDGSGEVPSTNMIIRLWSTLSPSEKRGYEAKAFAFFPIILSKDSRKYNKLAIWLSTSQGVVCTSLRDSFSAGGRVTLTLEGVVFFDLPQVFKTIFDLKERIVQIIKESNPEELSLHWETKVSERNKFSIWLDMAEYFSGNSIGKGRINPLRKIFEGL